MISPSEYRLTEADYQALEEIRRVQASDRTSHWERPDGFAYKYAYRLSTLPPAAALERAREQIRALHARNAKALEESEKAQSVTDELNQNPITNAGSRGFIGYMQRQFLAILNGTPFNRLDWFEVDGNGLQIFQPFAIVSQRTVKQRDLLNGNVVLSVNPSAYFDRIIGVLRQFRRTVPVPWGEIVVYEPGSGNTIGRAVALRPDRKVQQMRAALEKIHQAENPYAHFERVPKLEDFLVYYDTEQWSDSEPLPILNRQEPNQPNRSSMGPQADADPRQRGPDRSRGDSPRNQNSNQNGSQNGNRNGPAGNPNNTDPSQPPYA